MDDQGVVVRPDQVTLGVLVTAVPRDAVDAAVAACGVGDRRGGGKLPAHVVAYLTMGLCLFRVPSQGTRRGMAAGRRDRVGQGLRTDRGGNPARRCDYAPNAMGNFCFEVTLGYRRLERGR